MTPTHRLAIVALAAASPIGAASADPLFPPIIPLDDVDGVIGFRIDGARAGDHCGSAVASAGDINHDGVADLLIGAYAAASSSGVSTGRGYVMFGHRAGGPSFPPVFPLESLSAADGFTLDGFGEGDWNGEAAAPAGDFNGDGIDDLIIGAPNANPSGSADAGQAYVVFGRDTASEPGFPATIALGALDGVTGVRLDGIDPGDRSAISVAAAGDVNGDGVGDIIIGALNADPGGRSSAGETYVVFGRDTTSGAVFPPGLPLSTLNGTNGFRLDGVAAGDQSGGSVAAAGDFNHDGVDDLVIGANTAAPGGRFLAGAVYVVFGRISPFPASIPLASLDGMSGFRMEGLDFGDTTGRAVASGDINGDGISDILIGSPQAGGPPHGGSVYVVFGRDTSTGPAFGASFNLGSLNGANGFRINGPLTWTGLSVASVDINGDGAGDVLIGAPSAGAWLGRSYVLFGRHTSTEPGFPAVVSLDTLNGTNGFAMTATAPEDEGGLSLGAAGDVDGDGVEDLIVGAPSTPRDEREDVGAAYIVYGRRAACPADLNGDGIIDFGDYLEFLNLFNSGDPRADFTADGIVDFADYLEFLNHFDAGC